MRFFHCAMTLAEVFWIVIPREGFSVRNFQIQAAKWAQVSDIVIYGDSQTDYRIIKSVAERTARVQRMWRKEVESTGQSPETFHTFVLTEPFEDFERSFPEHVAVDSLGQPSDDSLDFLLQERQEMCAMSRASEYSRGVYQGPSPDPATLPTSSSDEDYFDLYVEASDHAGLPDETLLAAKRKELDNRKGDNPVQLAVPSSGSILPPSWSMAEVDGILLSCKWIYDLTHERVARSQTPVKDKDGDIQMTELRSRHRKVLLHCADGYTETSMFAVAYFMYSEGLPVHEAWGPITSRQGSQFLCIPL